MEWIGTGIALMTFLGVHVLMYLDHRHIMRELDGIHARIIAVSNETENVLRDHLENRQ